MRAQPRHRFISRELMSEIALGKHSAGNGRLPSEAQLAERFNVSRPTAARALRDLQEQGIIQRRMGSGSFVCDSRPAAKPASARELGLLYPFWVNPGVFEYIYGDIAGFARANDFLLLWDSVARPAASAEASVAQAERLCRQYIERRVAGVFFQPWESMANCAEMNFQLAEQLHRAGLPIVLLDRDLVPFPRRTEFDLIEVDNFAGGYLIAEHLIKLGCRRMVFLSHPNHAPTVDARIAGAREAHRVHEIALPAQFVHDVLNRDLPAFAASLKSARHRPEAVICVNDVRAMQLARELQQQGRRVPQDVRVTGFDDVKYASLVSPQLTTVRQPSRSIGEVAFRAMAERIAQPSLPCRTLTLMPTLVVRESCGAYTRRT
jgi:DNA-binding LacI/PurR family transcriptional regulator